MNKTTLRFFSWLTLLTFLPFSAAFAAPAGQFTKTSGYVAVTDPSGALKSAGNGDGVESGQTVQLGDGASAVIKFQDGQVIALQSKSIFKVNSYKYEQAAPEKGESFFSLLQGGLRSITGLIGNSNKAGWKLASPTATIGIRGTNFLAVVNQGLYLQVDTGVITATNSAGTVAFTAGQTGFVATGAAAGAVIPASAVPAGTFTELSAISVGAASGAATGAAAASGTILGVPTAAVIGVGIAAGVAVAASSGGDDSTTTHH